MMFFLYLRKERYGKGKGYERLHQSGQETGEEVWTDDLILLWKKQKSDKNINLNLRYKIQGFSVIPLESEECSASVQISASLHCTKDDIFGWLQFWYTNIHFVEQDQLEGKTQSSLWDTVLCMVLSQEVDRTFLLWGVHKSKVGLQSPHHQVV